MRLYPVDVQSLADITRAALRASGLTQRDFAAAMGVGVSTITNLLNGGTVKQETVDRLAAYLPDQAAAITAAALIYRPDAKRGGRTPEVSRNGMALHGKSALPVQPRRGRRSSQQLPVPREGKPVWHPDPHWAMLAAVWPSLTVEIHTDLVNRANRAAARAKRQKLPTIAPKAVG